MEQKSGAQISAQAFVQSVVILLFLMLAAGILTLVVPAGSYARVMREGREVIDPQSFQPVARPDYPVWRWATAPIEVLWGPDAVTIITIIVFLLMVGSSFAVLDASGILKAAIGNIVRAFGGKKYLCCCPSRCFFMLLGAFLASLKRLCRSSRS